MIQLLRWPKKLNRNSCVGVTPFQSDTNLNEKYLFNGDVFVSNPQKHGFFEKECGEVFILNGAIYLIKTSHFLRDEKIGRRQHYWYPDVCQKKSRY